MGTGPEVSIGRNSWKTTADGKNCYILYSVMHGRWYLTITGKKLTRY